MMMAMATAASAAAIVIIKMAKKIPSILSGYRYLLNATKLMFTLFRISSMDMSMVIMFRRVKNPYMPVKKQGGAEKQDVCQRDAVHLISVV
jgi:hypothetical protein